MESYSQGSEEKRTLNLTEEDTEIINEFITESKETIEEIESLLIELEKDVSQLSEVDAPTLNKIFRVFHSIKGSAGFIGLKITSSVTHQAETLLDMIRKEKISLEEVHINIFLELCDFFMNLLNQLQETYSESGFEAVADDFIRRLDALINESDSPPPASRNENRQAAEKASETGPAGPEKNPETKTEDGAGLEDLISPEMVNQFLQDGNELLDGLEQDLIKLENDSHNEALIESAFRALHSLKGNAGFFGYSDVEVVCHKAESFLEDVRSEKIQPSTEHFTLLLQIQDFLQKALDNLAGGEPPVITGKAGLLTLMDDFLLSACEPEPAAVAEKEELHPAEPETADEPEKAEAPEPAAPIQPQPAAMKAAPGREKPPEKKMTSSAKNNEVIRVDVNRLNKLMDLVGEIVIAESMVAQHPEIVEQELPGFEKSVMQLKKYIRELQELATSMRMIPLSGIFRKMIRLVRDLSNKSDKKVELVIIGGETEVDRSVIENISDPLVHIIRNSVDHGIEPREVRKKLGKPETGTITLEAKQIGGEIRISIRDDGAGLNRDKILSKAAEKGLIQKNGSEISDEEVWNLIFAPGFSTADKVTDISGRGVGMDVVVRNIEKIRGKVEVSSTEKEGSTFNLRIPLTTAIVDSMLARVYKSVYAIPMFDIKESVQVSSRAITHMINGQEVVKIRDRLIPVIRIHDLHRMDCERKELPDGILVIVENGGKTVAIFVDELIEQKQIVVKALPAYVGNVEAVSGCAILGNGETSLILDISSLIKAAELSKNKQELLSA